jgi:ankyrin repeat protein
MAVQWLLKNGAKVEAKDKNGWTALHSAVKNKHEKVVRLLLENGADVNEKESSGWQPLHSAAENGLKDMVSLLLDKGAQDRPHRPLNWCVDRTINKIDYYYLSRY